MCLTAPDVAEYECGIATLEQVRARHSFRLRAKLLGNHCMINF